MPVLRRNKMGRGVYADCSYIKGAIVDRCPIIFVPKREIDSEGVLIHYVYDLGRGRLGVVCGNGMLYNHAEDPNLAYWVSGAHMVYTATRPIMGGDQLFIDYGSADFLPEKMAAFAQGRTLTVT
jgi:hypothetical protein